MKCYLKKKDLRIDKNQNQAVLRLIWEHFFLNVKIKNVPHLETSASELEVQKEGLY